MSPLVWVVLALILAIIEMFTLDFLLIMLAIACLGAAVASSMGLGAVTQALVFAAIAIVLVLLVRPWARRIVHRSIPEASTNVDALVGKTARVVEGVDTERGLVRLDGEIWTARTVDGELLSPGQTCRVIEIDGATAVVIAVPEPGSPDDVNQ